MCVIGEKQCAQKMLLAIYKFLHIMTSTTPSLKESHSMNTTTCSGFIRLPKNYS